MAEGTATRRGTLVLATENPGKLVELRRLLVPCSITTVSMKDAGVDVSIDEGVTSYEDNARLKAETVAAATGMPALGEDSGLELLALGGWPGPISHRWLGPDTTETERLDALLVVIANLCPTDKRARFVTAMAIARPGEPTEVAVGTCDGQIVAPQGNNGFGYDAAFRPDGLSVTLAQATPAAKDAVSHRAKALRQLLDRGALNGLE